MYDCRGFFFNQFLFSFSFFFSLYFLETEIFFVHYFCSILQILSGTKPTYSCAYRYMTKKRTCHTFVMMGYGNCIHIWVFCCYCISYGLLGFFFLHIFVFRYVVIRVWVDDDDVMYERGFVGWNGEVEKIKIWIFYSFGIYWI